MKIHLNSESKTRTKLQNRALYKFLELLADKLNESGLSFYTVLLRRTNKFIDLHLERFGKPQNEYETGFVDALESVRATLPKVETSWNKDLVKEFFWVPVQKKAVGKTKTSECKTKDYGVVYEALNLALGEQLGVHVPWPQDETKTR